MAETPATTSKLVLVCFAAVCAGGLAALIYFAHSAALQSTPAYSTLNTNPDGAKLLFDGLSEAGLAKISRQFKSVALQTPRQSSVFFLGVNQESLLDEDEAYLNEMENSASRGNGLVIARLNDFCVPFPATGHRKESLLEKRWGIHFTCAEDGKPANTIFDMNWKSIEAGVWDRSFGRGSITFIENGQRLSNRGVAKESSNRELLFRLASRYPAVVFEEAHLGISETGSIAGLARHYRLQGLVAGLILVAGLFIWSRSVSFPPVPPAPEKILQGVDTRSMLTELMSRHLKGQLIATCIAEWNRTRGHAPALSPADNANAVAAYARLQEGFEKRTKFTL